MATRSSPMDEGTKEFIAELVNASMESVKQSITDVTTQLSSVLVQQNYFTKELQKIRTGESGSRRGSLQLTRLTKLDFPKFDGDDVKDWLYRCNQFLCIDDIEEEDKVKVASIHLYKKALQWHQQYIKTQGEDVDWITYQAAIVKRFGTTVDDPMAELKHLKQTASIQEYQDAFEDLLNKVDITEKQAISMYLGGLKKEIELPVRMFKPNSLEDTFCLAKLQEDTIEATKKKVTPILPTPRSTYNSYQSRSVSPATQANTVLALPPAPSRLALPAPRAQNQRKQLTQKELEDKRAKGLCFYCDQKYIPGHKCTGQLYSLEIILDEEETISDEVMDPGESPQPTVLEEEAVHSPHISLNALTGTTAYQTKRVCGKVQNKTLHILIDSDSTHNFLDLDMAKKLGCNLKQIRPMTVKVPGGNQIVSTNECTGFKWKMLFEVFVDDMIVIPLGGCDMVLGIQWLKPLGDIVWNFDSLQMVFKYGNKRMVLRGTTKKPVQWMDGKRLGKTMDHQEIQLSSMTLCVYPIVHFGMIEAVQPAEGQQQIVTQLLEDYVDVFETPKGVPPKRSHDHRIPLKEGTMAVNIRPYRHPPT
ncbi:uncharacterized protein [Rutidosis leptorrhynchoides]|uniref:uncharacterized protein n=1 Tax=Rutidosis leptorrhynchoides TaxID=125765 RepID=UPI003A99CA68